MSATQAAIVLLKQVVNQAQAAAEALRHYQGACESGQADLPSALRLSDLRSCLEDVEGTYLIRLFASFEATLRRYWSGPLGRKTRPQAKHLVDRVAAHRKMPHDVLTAADRARSFRNALVHGGVAPPMTLAEARRALCVYLSYLPRDW